MVTFLIILAVWLLIGYIRYRKVMVIFGTGPSRIDVVLMMPFILVVGHYVWIRNKLKGKK